MTKKKTLGDLRSQRWLGASDLRSTGHRSRIRKLGYGPDDFANKPMEELLSSLKIDGGPQGIPIPSGATRLGARLKPDRPHSSIMMTARVLDGNGRYYSTGDSLYGHLRRSDLHWAPNITHAPLPIP